MTTYEECGIRHLLVQSLLSHMTIPKLSSIPERMTLLRHIEELLQEYDAAKRLKPSNFKELWHKYALIRSAKSDLATQCRVLRLCYATRDLPAVLA